ncbi:DEDDh 3'-5' exonuclease [Citromicrobium phage vB_CbaS-RXM]|nr:DEDDh 3'-5' exonuclease [Citromicrobium phage vB_CbaS-RXM]
MKILYYDTETTGLPNRNRSLDYPTQPYVAQLAYLLEGDDGELIEENDLLIKPYDDKWIMSPQSQAIHGKTREMCEEQGLPLPEVMDIFIDAIVECDVLVCHNVSFDKLLLQIQAAKMDKDMQTSAIFEGKPHVCTMLAAMPICKLPKKDRKTGWKWPTLQETHVHFFGEQFDGAHDAMADITATRRVFRELAKIGALDEPFRKVGLEAPTYG